MFAGVLAQRLMFQQALGFRPSTRWRVGGSGTAGAGVESSAIRKMR
jgi:hypothetical protein